MIKPCTAMTSYQDNPLAARRAEHYVQEDQVPNIRTHFRRASREGRPRTLVINRPVRANAAIACSPHPDQGGA